MTVLALTVGFVAWAVAAFGFVLFASAYAGLLGKAPIGQRFAAALEIGWWNFPAVRRRLGSGAEPLLARYRRGGLIFFCSIVLFFVALFINIASGNAA